MQRSYRQNPYCLFKDDRERRRALNFRVVGYVAIAALTAAGAELPEKLTWLMHMLG